MSAIANKQAICDVLLEHAQQDQDVVVLCSDSRGSSSMTPFAEQFPKQFVETGIAEQNLVSIAAGLAKCGKKAFVASPACFLSTRSLEQVKVDVAYSGTNVKLVGVSGGVSYGALGMTHHSTGDIAAIAAIPGMRVYLPSDSVETRALFEALIEDDKPAYIRVGRNAVDEIYTQDRPLPHPFVPDKAIETVAGGDITIIACGEMVSAAVKASEMLKKREISCRVLDMYCVKPLDTGAVLKAARETKAIITMEEHVAFGGLGALVSQCVSAQYPRRVVNLSLPDEPAVTGVSREVFDYYGLNAQGAFETALKLLESPL